MDAQHGRPLGMFFWLGLCCALFFWLPLFVALITGWWWLLLAGAAGGLSVLFVAALR